MKDSEIYLRAAKLCDQGGWASCFAVNEIVCGHRFLHTKQSQSYADIYMPYNHNSLFAWEWGRNKEDIKSCRVLALLFMRQIALDEERGK